MAKTDAVKKHGQITVTFLVYQEDDQYAAECRELGTTSCGDTLDEAFENIQEAVSLHLETLDELGELEAFIQKRGIQVRPLATIPHEEVPESGPPYVTFPAMRAPAGAVVQMHDILL